MTDRTLSAADWAAMRARCNLRDWPDGYWDHVRENIANEHFTLLNHAPIDLPLALDHIDRLTAALADRDATIARLREAVVLITGDGPWTDDSGDGESTPKPFCFYCSRSSWGQRIEDHAPDCKWLKLQALTPAKEADRE